MKIWFTLNRCNDKWTLWKNTEVIKAQGGSGGIDKIFSSEQKEEVIKYCKDNKINIKYKKRKR